MRPPTTVAALLTVIALLAVGCGDDRGTVQPDDGRAVAEAMIVGDLAEAAGLGPLTARCDDPGPLALGSTFGCTGLPVEAGPDATPVQVQATVEADGRLSLATTNLITAAALPGFERAAADDLRSNLRSAVSPDDVDCGAGPVVLAAGGVLGCTLAGADGSEPRQLTLTVVDLDTRRVTAALAPPAGS